MHLYLLFVCTNMIGFGMQFYETISYRAFVGLHVCTLRWVHQLIIYEHTSWLEGSFILIRIVRIGIRRVHCRSLVLVQIYTLRRRGQHGQTRVRKFLVKSPFVTFDARVLRWQPRIIYKRLLSIGVFTFVYGGSWNLTSSILAHLSGRLHWLFIQVSIPRSAQVTLLVGLIHEAAAVRFVGEVLTFFEVVVCKLLIIFVLSGLLSAKHECIVALGQIGVLVGHLGWRLFIHVIITHTLWINLTLLMGVVDGHRFPRLIIEIGCGMRPLVEREWLWLACHGRLRVPSACAIMDHLVATGKRI